MSPDVEGRLGRVHRLWPAFTLALVGVAMVLAGLAWQAARERSPISSPSGAPALSLPRQLLGQPRTRQQTGPDALAAIESMHGKGFALTDAAIARYGDAMLWVARTRDQAAARSMDDAMTRRIADSGSPFTPTGTRQLGGLTVHALVGMGQTHFYWQTADKVIWLAIDPLTAERGLREIIESIR